MKRKSNVLIGLITRLMTHVIFEFIRDYWDGM